LNASRRHLRDFRRHRVELNKIVDRQTLRAESPDRKNRPIQRQWWDNGVYARPVGQTGIDHRGAFIYSSPHSGYDPLDNLHQVAVIAKPDIAPLKFTVSFHKNMTMSVDQDIGDFGIFHEGF